MLINKQAFKYCIGTLCLFFQLALPVFAEDVENNDWFFEDFEEKINRVNEGQLRFLSQHPDKKIHSHVNQLTISEKSLKTGWSTLRQCHENLDALDAVQISFNESTTRNHVIESYSNINRVWIDRSNVELEGIKHNAKLCLTLETRNIHVEKNKEYVVRNGPFMRQFLDGFYPIHVRLDVNYPCGLIRFIKTKNIPQQGFSVTADDCIVSVDAWFEGKLYTELLFEKIVENREEEN